DRILFRSNDNVHKLDVDAIVQNVAYNSVQNYCFSDHKPVYAIFSVHIVSGAIK
uniref:Uncharacterized protein n=1 Tax=Romanomermis culicivorax TaxID=13658 RepID=A0A915KBE3_ROMCU